VEKGGSMSATTALLFESAIAADQSAVAVLEMSLLLVEDEDGSRIAAGRIQFLKIEIARLKRRIERCQDEIATITAHERRRSELEKRRAQAKPKTEQAKSPVPANDTVFRDATGTVSGYSRKIGNSVCYYRPGQKFAGREFAGTAIDAAGRFKGKGQGLGVSFLQPRSKKASNTSSRSPKTKG
jgi:hypothetical protein